MENSFRWYGPNDPVSLSDIRQTNAEYIVSSLHQIPYGEKWRKNDIKKRINFINKHNSSNNVNLKWNVVESIPVHNNIKLRHKNYKKLIDNYKDTIANIAKNNIKTICYNFMPIVDWTRTQLDFQLPTDGLALKFNYLQIIIFEMFILKLKDLDQRYTKTQIKNAEVLFKKMRLKDINNMKFSIMGGLPASETNYSIREFKKMLDVYRNIQHKDLRENLSDFIKEIIPVAEENNVKMAIHPDDPPIPLFGVPRIVSTMDDYKFILNSYNSQSNGMTFCSGSLASNINNNIYKIFNKFKDKINFIHLRNVKIEKDRKSFYESNHLSGDVDFVKLIKMILKEESRRSKNKKIEIPMRPDHGHCLLDDQKKKTFNPGYTAIGRLMGLSELRGIIKAV
ncbi:mannonate dehydratase, partial [Alphaproteobacteria bacterium]|nr:mannonate dehydratase [Alphaproteobacteria bacterium]